MYQLVYISFKSPIFNPEGADGIDSILNLSKSRNHKREITGMLLYRSGVFVQLLEGDKKVVLDLFGRIASDFRHEAIKILLKQEAKERIFPDWTMGFYDLSIEDPSKILTNASWQEVVNQSMHRERVDPELIKKIFLEFRYVKKI